VRWLVLFVFVSVAAAAERSRPPPPEPEPPEYVEWCENARKSLTDARRHPTVNRWITAGEDASCLYRRYPRCAQPASCDEVTQHLFADGSHRAIEELSGSLPLEEFRRRFTRTPAYRRHRNAYDAALALRATREHGQATTASNFAPRVVDVQRLQSDRLITTIRTVDANQALQIFDGFDYW